MYPSMSIFTVDRLTDEQITAFVSEFGGKPANGDKTEWYIYDTPTYIAIYKSHGRHKYDLDDEDLQPVIDMLGTFPQTMITLVRNREASTIALAVKMMQKFHHKFVVYDCYDRYLDNSDLSTPEAWEELVKTMIT